MEPLCLIPPLPPTLGVQQHRRRTRRRPRRRRGRRCSSSSQTLPRISWIDMLCIEELHFLRFYTFFQDFMIKCSGRRLYQWRRRLFINNGLLHNIFKIASLQVNTENLLIHNFSLFKFLSVTAVWNPERNPNWNRKSFLLYLYIRRWLYSKHTAQVTHMWYLLVLSRQKSPGHF